MMRTMRRLICHETRRYIFGEVAEWSNAPDSKSGLRYCRNVGSNPTLSARNANAPCGRFAFLEKWWCGRTHRVRQICLEQIWTAEGWLRAQRGARRMDAPSNPTLSARNANAPCGRFAFLEKWWCGRTHRVRQICLEQIWTAEGWPRAQRGARRMDAP